MKSKKDILILQLQRQILEGESGILLATLDKEDLLKENFYFYLNDFKYVFVNKELFYSEDSKTFFKCEFHRYREIEFYETANELGSSKKIKKWVRFYWSVNLDVGIKRFCLFNEEKLKLEKFYEDLVPEETKKIIQNEKDFFNEVYSAYENFADGTPEKDEYIEGFDNLEKKIGELENVRPIIDLDDDLLVKEFHLCSKMLDLMTGIGFNNYEHVPPSNVRDLVRLGDFTVYGFKIQKVTRFNCRSESHEEIRERKLMIEGLQVEFDKEVKADKLVRTRLDEACKRIELGLSDYYESLSKIKDSEEKDEQKRGEVLKIMSSLESDKATLENQYGQQLEIIDKRMKDLKRELSVQRTVLYSVENCLFVISDNYASQVTFKQLQDKLIFMKDVKFISDTYQQDLQRGSLRKLSLLLSRVFVPAHEKYDKGKADRYARIIDEDLPFGIAYSAISFFLRSSTSS